MANGGLPKEVWDYKRIGQSLSLIHICVMEWVDGRQANYKGRGGKVLRNLRVKKFLHKGNREDWGLYLRNFGVSAIKTRSNVPPGKVTINNRSLTL